MRIVSSIQLKSQMGCTKFQRGGGGEGGKCLPTKSSPTAAIPLVFKHLVGMRMLLQFSVDVCSSCNADIYSLNEKLAFVKLSTSAS